MKQKILLNFLNSWFDLKPADFLLKVLVPITLIIGTFMFLAMPLFVVKHHRSLVQDKIPVYTDFSAYLTAARVLKYEKPQALYDYDIQQKQQLIIHPEGEDGLMAYLNPPILAYLFLPLASLPIWQAFTVGLIFVISLMAVNVFFFFRYWKLRGVLLFFLLTFYPLLSNITYMQISVLILLVFSLCYCAFSKGRFFTAGLVAGLLFLKLQYLIFIPFLLLLSEKKMKTLLGVLVSIGVLTLGSLWVFRGNFLDEYSTILKNGQNLKHGQLTEINYNLFGLLSEINIIFKINLPALLIALILSVVLLTTTLYLMRKQTLKGQPNKNVLFSAAIILSLTLNPHTQYTDLNYLIVPIILLYREKLTEYKLISIILYLTTFMFGSLAQGFIGLIYTALGFYLITKRGAAVSEVANELKESKAIVSPVF